MEKQRYKVICYWLECSDDHSKSRWGQDVGYDRFSKSRADKYVLKMNRDNQKGKSIKFSNLPWDGQNAIRYERYEVKPDKSILERRVI